MSKLNNTNASGVARPVNASPRLTGRAARSQMAYTTVRILALLDEGKVWPHGAQEHEMQEQFGDLGKAIDALRDKRQIMVKAKSENRGRGLRITYVITSTGRARLKRLREAAAAEPEDAPRPLWLERTEAGRRSAPAAPKNLSEWGRRTGGRPTLAGPNAESGRLEAVGRLTGGVIEREEGFDELRSTYRNLRAGFDECSTRLQASAWRGRGGELRKRLEWQLSAHLPGTPERLRWASASRILGVCVGDLKSLAAAAAVKAA